MGPVNIGTKSSFVPLAQAFQSDKDVLDYDTTDRSVVTGRDATGRARVGRDPSGPTTDDAMTRSQEELQVGTTQREQGRVRLRKYVTTEREALP